MKENHEERVEEVLPHDDKDGEERKNQLNPSRTSKKVEPKRKNRESYSDEDESILDKEKHSRKKTKKPTEWDEEDENDPMLEKQDQAEDAMKDEEKHNTNSPACNFTKEELHLLQEINQLQLNDLSNIPQYNLDPLVFRTLLNRESATQAISDLGRKQYDAFQQGNINKQDLIFLIAKGLSGNGKTRMAIEISKILSKIEPQSIFKNSSICYFNFTNGFF
nr:unnamed protein product [Naegleria fowleri]